MSRKEAMREKTPLSISVAMETRPPVMGTVPIYNKIFRSRKGFTRPTAQTRGSTRRSL